MGKDSVAVRIAGHEYKIRSDGDPAALREIAGYVDRAMSRVRDRTGTVDTLDVSVLTCLNLAREILALHEERTPEGATSVEETKLRGLIERVEGALGGRIDVGPAVAGDVEEQAPAASEGDAPAGSEAPRTLDLPSVESLRERASQSAGEHEEEVADAMPEARVAAGGRDRAS